MAKTNSSDSPTPNESRGARAQRIVWLMSRAADTLGRTGNGRRNFIAYATRNLIFTPQVVASSIVLAPRQARWRQKWSAAYDSGLVFTVPGAGLVAFLAHDNGWITTIFLLLLICFIAVPAWIVMIVDWSARAPALYAATPPPGSTITADAGALTIGSTVLPWPKVALAAIWLREGTWFGTYWSMPESVDRLTLKAGGETLMLDRHIVSDGQRLLDTICDKLDMTLDAHGAAAGDVNPARLTLYADRAGAAGKP